MVKGVSSGARVCLTLAESPRIWTQTLKIWMLALSLASLMILGNLFNLSVPQFL